MNYSLPEGFVKELGCTVRTCVGCGCLVSGGPTRCTKCAKEFEHNRHLLPTEVEPIIDKDELRKGRYDLFVTAMRRALKALGINNVVVEHIYLQYNPKKKFSFRVYRTDERGQK